jgi:hypothetical protein
MLRRLGSPGQPAEHKQKDSKEKDYFYNTPSHDQENFCLKSPNNLQKKDSKPFQNITNLYINSETITKQDMFKEKRKTYDFLLDSPSKLLIKLENEYEEHLEISPMLKK